MTDYLSVARELAIEAGRKIMELGRGPLIKERKADHSIVTNADHAADKIIREGLRKHFPDHAVLTEESGLEGSAGAEFVWIVDPLDGTRAFARGTEGFSVMIGLMHQGQLHAGVVMDPWRDRVYDALRGEGAYHTFQGKRERVHVSKRREWTEMPLVTSTDFPPPLEQAIKEKLPCPWIPSLNSVGIKVGLLARQEGDLYVNHHGVHYWDTAAPQIILEEAGGIITYADGSPLLYDLNSRFQHAHPTLASNGQRHSEFVSILNDVL